VLAKWMQPILHNGRFLWAPLNLIEACLDIAASLPIEKEEVKRSKIGLRVREVLEKVNPQFPPNVRDKAQALINRWLALVINDEQQKKVADQYKTPEQREMEREEKLEKEQQEKEQKLAWQEANGNVGNGHAPSSSSSSSSGGGFVFKETERDKFAIWQPSAKQEEEWAEQNKKRHALMPKEVFERPVFDRAAMPASLAPEMGRQKLVALDHKIRTMANPNKKGWKNTIEQIKISGSGIVYSFPHKD